MAEEPVNPLVGAIKQVETTDPLRGADGALLDLVDIMGEDIKYFYPKLSKDNAAQERMVNKYCPVSLRAMSYPQLTRQYMAVSIATFANLDRKYYWPKKRYLDEMIRINPLVQRYSHLDYETLDRLRWVLMIQRSRAYNAGIDGPNQQAFLQLHATLELEVVTSDGQADMLFDGAF